MEKFFEEQLQKWLPNYAKANKNHQQHRSSANLHNNTRGSNSGANSSPAPCGTASPSLAEGSGRKSANSLSRDDGCNPAKRLRSTE